MVSNHIHDFRLHVKFWILVPLLSNLVSLQMKLVRHVVGIFLPRYSLYVYFLDRIIHEATIERNAYPSPLNYYHFPKSVCT